eukprot:360666-Chlamydomonas_euryale.AAC.9
MAWHGTAWHGMAWHAMAWYRAMYVAVSGMAWHVNWLTAACPCPCRLLGIANDASFDEAVEAKRYLMEVR